MNMIKIFFIFLVIGNLFYKCSQVIDYKKYVISNVSSSVIDTLKFPTSGMINEVELMIKGKINGIAVIKIENGNERYKDITLKGRIDTLYRTEWYEPAIIFKYEPLSEIVGDSLVIFYRFR